MKMLSKLALVLIMCGFMPGIKGISGPNRQNDTEERLRERANQLDVSKRDRSYPVLLSAGGVTLLILLASEREYALLNLPLVLALYGWGINDYFNKGGHGGLARLLSWLDSIDIKNFDNG